MRYKEPTVPTASTTGFGVLLPLPLALALILMAFALLACSQPEEPPTQEAVPGVEDQPRDDAVAVAEKEAEAPKKQWAIALHGGAGDISKDAPRAAHVASLTGALNEGRRLLSQGSAAMDVVEEVVAILEDDPLFNAGRGAVFTNRGTHELDAAIMDGRTLACGAAAGLLNVRNPIRLARAVMQKSSHVLLTGQGAEDFSKEVGVRRAPQDYFSTPERLRQWQTTRREERESRGSGAASAAGFGTVGVVALDQYGNLAAGTSTGGLVNKRYGRVGDVPIIGAGTYADNKTAAVSCTGKGEEFIRHSIAHDVTARMKYQGLSVEEAASKAIHETLGPNAGGLIAVDRNGQITMPFSTTGMYRAAADSEGLYVTGIWEDLAQVDGNGSTVDQ